MLILRIGASISVTIYVALTKIANRSEIAAILNILKIERNSPIAMCHPEESGSGRGRMLRELFNTIDCIIKNVL